MTSPLDSKSTSVPVSDSEKSAQIHHENPGQDDHVTIEMKKKEDALRRKLDIYIAPVMMMLMLISYLDRGNIGFAATQGMTTDIGLQGGQLNVRPPVLKICICCNRI